MPSFLTALYGKDKIKVIAEVKRASPSFGKFPPHHVAELVRAYEHGGAVGISVVTEPERFLGSLELLQEVRSFTTLPILRKDFIHDIDELEKSKKYGADAVLLIADILSKEAVTEFIDAATKIGLQTLLEVHSEADIQKIPRNYSGIVGINNRNLTTLETNVTHASTLLKLLDNSETVIAESAFQNTDDLRAYQGKVNGVLIGTALLTAPDPYKKLKEFTSQVPTL